MLDMNTDTETIAYLYDEALYHPLCAVDTVAPPTCAAYLMTTEDSVEEQLAFMRAVAATYNGDMTWPEPYPLRCIEDSDSCLACGDLIDPV